MGRTKREIPPAQRPVEKFHGTVNPTIIGVDPGTIITGYGIILKQGRTLTPIDCGNIKPPKSRKLSDRYLIIYESFCELIDHYKPHILAIETQYVGKNPQSAIKLGMARGVILLAAKQRDLSIYEYTPAVTKRAVVGNGHASKQQVQGMVERLLSLKGLSEDSADALALAICHSHSLAENKQLQFEI